METTKQKKTTRVASETKYEVYNRVNLAAVSEPMSKVEADDAVYKLQREHYEKFCNSIFNPIWIGKQLKKGFPYAIRKVGNKGYRIGLRDYGDWTDFWMENKRCYEKSHEQWTSERVADFVRLINMSGVLKQKMMVDYE